MIVAPGARGHAPILPDRRLRHRVRR